MGPGLVDWTEELWLKVIETVKMVTVQGKNRGGKWKAVENMLPADLLSKFSGHAVKASLLQSRFYGLSWEIRGNHKLQRYTKGVTERVVKEMSDFLGSSKRRKAYSWRKRAVKATPAKWGHIGADAGRRGGNCNEVKRMGFREHMETRFESLRSWFYEQLAPKFARRACKESHGTQYYSVFVKREFNSLGVWFEKQLVPTATQSFASLWTKCKLSLLDESSPSCLRLKLSNEAAFGMLRAQITGKAKEASYFLRSILRKSGDRHYKSLASCGGPKVDIEVVFLHLRAQIIDEVKLMTYSRSCRILKALKKALQKAG